MQGLFWLLVWWYALLCAVTALVLGAVVLATAGWHVKELLWPGVVGE